MPDTFGQLADQILGALVRRGRTYKATRLDFVCARYRAKSINGQKRKRRGQAHVKLRCVHVNRSCQLLLHAAHTASNGVGVLSYSQSTDTDVLCLAFWPDVTGPPYMVTGTKLLQSESMRLCERGFNKKTIHNNTCLALTFASGLGATMSIKTTMVMMRMMMMQATLAITPAMIA